MRCKELTHLKRPWCWERLRAGGEGGDRGWDGWITSLTWWIWVWVDSGSWWWTQGGLACCSSWGRKKSNTTEQLNWTEQVIYVLSRAVMSNSATPWTAVHQTPLSMGFSRQQYWSRLPFPPPGDLPDPGIKPMFYIRIKDVNFSGPPFSHLFF